MYKCDSSSIKSEEASRWVGESFRMRNRREKRALERKTNLSDALVGEPRLDEVLRRLGLVVRLCDIERKVSKRS